MTIILIDDHNETSFLTDVGGPQAVEAGASEASPGHGEERAPSSLSISLRSVQFHSATETDEVPVPSVNSARPECVCGVGVRGRGRGRGTIQADKAGQ